MKNVKLHFTVADMVCAHCAATVKQVLEEGIKGAKADVSLAAKRVCLSAPAPADKAKITALLDEAGYKAEF